MLASSDLLSFGHSSSSPRRTIQRSLSSGIVVFDCAATSHVLVVAAWTDALRLHSFSPASWSDWGGTSRFCRRFVGYRSRPPLALPCIFGRTLSTLDDRPRLSSRTRSPQCLFLQSLLCLSCSFSQSWLSMTMQLSGCPHPSNTSGHGLHGAF